MAVYSVEPDSKATNPFDVKLFGCSLPAWQCIYSKKVSIKTILFFLGGQRSVLQNREKENRSKKFLIKKSILVILFFSSQERDESKVDETYKQILKNNFTKLMSLGFAKCLGRVNGARWLATGISTPELRDILTMSNDSHKLDRNFELHDDVRSASSLRPNERSKPASTARQSSSYCLQWPTSSGRREKII